MLRSKLVLVNLIMALSFYAVANAQEPTPTPEFSSWPISTSAPTLATFVPTVTQTPTVTPESTSIPTPSPMLTPVSLRVCAGTVAEHCYFIMIVAR